MLMIRLHLQVSISGREIKAHLKFVRICVFKGKANPDLMLTVAVFSSMPELDYLKIKMHSFFSLFYLYGKYQTRGISAIADFNKNTGIGWKWLAWLQQIHFPDTVELTV